MSTRQGLVILLCSAAIAGAQQSPDSRDPSGDRERATRLRSLELFQGADDTSTLTVEEYRAHLTGMCVDAAGVVMGYQGLVRTVPDNAADQPWTPAMALGNDFS